MKRGALLRELGENGTFQGEEREREDKREEREREKILREREKYPGYKTEPSSSSAPISAANEQTRERENNKENVDL